MNVGGVNNGLDLGKMFNTSLDSISKKGADIQAQMDNLMKDGEVDQTALMTLQFQMGIYKTMTETLSNITKSITDSMKSLAQRSG